MTLDELSLADQVALYVLPALLSTQDARKNLSHKTIIHEARQIALEFLATADLPQDKLKR